MSLRPIILSVWVCDIWKRKIWNLIIFQRCCRKICTPENGRCEGEIFSGKQRFFLVCVFFIVILVLGLSYLGHLELPRLFNLHSLSRL